jgi:hypothetical protein
LAGVVVTPADDGLSVMLDGVGAHGPEPPHSAALPYPDPEGSVSCPALCSGPCGCPAGNLDTSRRRRAGVARGVAQGNRWTEASRLPRQRPGGYVGPLPRPATRPAVTGPPRRRL